MLKFSFNLIRNIRNAFPYTGTYAGLFGQVGPNGIVENTGVLNESIYDNNNMIITHPATPAASRERTPAQSPTPIPPARLPAATSPAASRDITPAPSATPIPPARFQAPATPAASWDLTATPALTIPR